MFKGWINSMVTIVHCDPKKSVTGVVVSCCGESLVLRLVADSEGKPLQGQYAFCIRNPMYEKFIRARNDE